MTILYASHVNLHKVQSLQSRTEIAVNQIQVRRLQEPSIETEELFMHNP